MAADESKYHLLSDDDDISEDLSLETKHSSYGQSSITLSRPVWLWRVVAALVTLSCIIVAFLLGHNAGAKSGIASTKTPYLGLLYDQPHTIWWNTEFSNASKTATDADIDALWDTNIPWERGIIALGFDEARAMGLPESQPWPWDGRNKGIYIMNAHHLLHCVRILYISIQQFRRGIPQTIVYDHVLHCLDSLRVEVMCHADDTLRYIPINGDPPDGRYPGDGQERTCRDWSTVSAFVESHDPCYRYENPGDEDFPNLERFKFCPPDSEYLPLIREYFGYPVDWMPEEREGPRELDW